MLAQLAASFGLYVTNIFFLSVCNLPIKMCVEDEKEEEVRKNNAVTYRKCKMAARDYGQHYPCQNQQNQL